MLFKVDFFSILLFLSNFTLYFLFILRKLLVENLQRLEITLDLIVVEIHHTSLSKAMSRWLNVILDLNEILYTCKEYKRLSKF